MKRNATVRRILMAAALTLAWCGLWQGVSVANVIGGIAASVVVLSLGIGTPGLGGIRVVPLVRLAWLVLVDLVISTLEVAREIVTPNDGTDEAIIALDIPADARHHFLLLVVAITLTPGTAVVDADPDTGRLYLHLLHRNRRDDVAEHVAELARLACMALPTRTTPHRPAPGAT